MNNTPNSVSSTLTQTKTQANYYVLTLKAKFKPQKVMENLFDELDTRVQKKLEDCVNELMPLITNSRNPEAMATYIVLKMISKELERLINKISKEMPEEDLRLAEECYQAIKIQEQEAHYSDFIFVTGSDEILGFHIVKLLLANGLRVKAGVNSARAIAQTNPLFSLSQQNHSLSIVPIDFSSVESCLESLRFCQSLIHTGFSEYIYDISEKEEADKRIKNEIEWTSNIVKACTQQKIKKIIYTSDTATLSSGISDKLTTESCFSQAASQIFYVRSKIFTEREFWYLLQKNADIEVITLHPSLMVGPFSSKETGIVTTSFISRVLQGGLKRLPATSKIALVDVRDVALAHFLALKSADKNRQRYLISSSHSVSLEEIRNLLLSDLKHIGCKLPQEDSHPENIIDFEEEKNEENSEEGLLIENLKIWMSEMDNSKSVKDLEIKYRDWKESLFEMRRAIFINGDLELRIFKP